MNIYEILKDIIIPIISATISGLCTFWGVFITIQHEKRKEKEERVLANKPLFYRLDPMQEYPYKEAVDFIVQEIEAQEKEWKIWGILKNTDNAILIIDSVVINKKIYKPLYGDVVDKNQIFNFYLFTSEKIKCNDNIVLIIKDTMKNKYRYKLEIKNDEKSSEIIGFKEI